ncbi:PilN domain-containing protein [Psychromonas sp. KJ10-10]|uniref:PilN domain-containing protein n=1 Tax=Psychromonas sp. KJ10-10 TaxID=3391823 RepID=UPI0039B37668
MPNQQLMLSDLVQTLQKNRAPEDKLRLQQSLQEEVKAKQRLLTRLSGIDLQESVSFSELMRGLSYANMPEVTINHFSMVERTLNISGEAKQSDSVPLWLSNIQLTKELSSVAFKALSITENEGVFSFQLTNTDVKGNKND